MQNCVVSFQSPLLCLPGKYQFCFTTISKVGDLATLATLAIFCQGTNGKFRKPKSDNLAGNCCNINRQAVFLSQWIPSNDFLFQGSLETRGACIQKKPCTERYILLMGQIVYSQDMYECGIGERDNLKSINLFSSLAAL